MNIELKQLNRNFSICKLADLSHVDLSRNFTFLSKTDDELSLLCETQYLPPNPQYVEHGWKALKICGILDFGQIGIIAKISGILADSSIPVFVVSTYNTDYILVKAENYDKTLDVLIKKGYALS